jgi:hypothetical protein
MNMMMLDQLANQKIIVDPTNTLRAFAYEGAVIDIMSNGTMVKGSSLTLTFDEQEVTDEHRLATGDELNWWACTNEDVPKEQLIECSDGLYMWLEIGTYDWDFGYDGFSAKFMKLDK